MATDLKTCPTCDLAMVEMYDLDRRVKGLGCAIHGVPEVEKKQVGDYLEGMDQQTASDVTLALDDVDWGEPDAMSSCIASMEDAGVDDPEGICQAAQEENG